MKKTIINAFCFYVFTLVACLAAEPAKPVEKSKSILDGLSVETVGALRHSDFGTGVWGAGADVGFRFNKWVTGHVRALSYETDNWHGGVVDEGSLYAEATLFSADRVRLAGTGGGHRDFENDDWGFGVGLRPSVTLIKNRLDLFGAAELRAWFNQPKDLLTTFGLSLKF